MRAFRTALFLCLFTVTLGFKGVAQLSLPGFGSRTPASNDQKAAKLLHDKLPLVLDANSAYPTVPDQDMLGGPFRGQLLHITLDTLTKPLAPGDYVLPMMFFCSEYSIHRPGAGTAYVLAPAQGTSARAISTLLWRGMLAGYKPQDLQSVSWAIQGSVPYSNMPQTYRNTIDQLIPDMKNQVNGQAFLDIEDGFQGKVNRFTHKINQGMTKATGGYVKFDMKMDLELNDSFTRLGQLGRSALDGENIAQIVQDTAISDTKREQVLYAGQGSQAPPLPAVNGPWSVIVPGVAYMRFQVHGGNMRGDNLMQIRILKPGTSTAARETEPELVLAQYTTPQSSTPSLEKLFNGRVNEAAIANCQTSSARPAICSLSAMDFGGLDAFSIGAGSQSPIMTPTEPLASAAPAAEERVCVKRILYQPTVFKTYDTNLFGDIRKPERVQSEALGLCNFLAVISDDGKSCSGLTTAVVPEGEKLNWVQSFEDDFDPLNPKCVNKTCTDGGPGPLYRPDNKLFEEGEDFDKWKTALSDLGPLKMLFRDVPHRDIYNVNPKNVVKHFAWFTDPSGATDPLDNNLRLVSYKPDGPATGVTHYTPLIQIKYGYHFDVALDEFTTDPLLIGQQAIERHPSPALMITPIRALKAKYAQLPLACTNTNQRTLGPPPQFPLVLP